MVSDNVDKSSKRDIGAQRYVLRVGHSDDAGLGGEGWVVRMSDHFSESETAQRWVKSEDYEALRQRFERACGRVTELEGSAHETEGLKYMVTIEPHTDRIKMDGRLWMIEVVRAALESYCNRRAQDTTRETTAPPGEAARVREIFARHERINKLLYSIGPPGTILGPMDSDAAHRDRGFLLSILTPKQRGDQETAGVCQCGEQSWLGNWTVIEDSTHRKHYRDKPCDAQHVKASATHGSWQCVNCSVINSPAVNNCINCGSSYQ